MTTTIETVYKNIRFRSRLEARWAVFFDTIGLPYRYETEGVDLDGVYFLPDFWLPKHNCWLVIRTRMPFSELEQSDDWYKADILSHQTRWPVYVFPGDVSYSTTGYGVMPMTVFDGGNLGHTTLWRGFLYWMECPNCQEIDIIRIASDDGAIQCRFCNGYFYSKDISSLLSLGAASSKVITHAHDAAIDELRPILERAVEPLLANSVSDRLMKAFMEARNAQFEG